MDEMNSLIFSILVLSVLYAHGKLCGPPQLQAHLDVSGTVETIGVCEPQMGRVVLYLDSSMKMAAYNINVTTGTSHTIMTAIEDYSMSPAVRYEITHNSCLKKAPLFDMEPFCLPDGAKEKGSTIIGDPMYGQNVTVYTYSSGNMSALKSAVSPNGIPVIQEQSFTISGAKISQTIVYYDVKTSISDPSVFNIPAICHKHVNS